MNKLLGCLAFFGVTCVSVVVVAAWLGISTTNKEVELNNSFEAQKKVCEVVFDRVWKVLRDQVGVADKYKDSFKEIFVGMVEKRYENDSNVLTKFVTESSNVPFNSGIYDKLMVAIESNRKDFEDAQKRLVAIKESYDNLTQKFPGNVIIRSPKKLELFLVTSATTKETFKTGEDNTELFQSKSVDPLEKP